MWAHHPCVVTCDNILNYRSETFTIPVRSHLRKKIKIIFALIPSKWKKKKDLKLFRFYYYCLLLFFLLLFVCAVVFQISIPLCNVNRQKNAAASKCGECHTCQRRLAFSHCTTWAKLFISFCDNHRTSYKLCADN